MVSPEVRRTIAATGIAKHQRERWLQTVPTAQIASFLFLYSEIVPDGSTKEKRIGPLRTFLEDVKGDPVLPAKSPAKAVLSFLEQLMEGLNLITNGALKTERFYGVGSCAILPYFSSGILFHCLFKLA